MSRYLCALRTTGDALARTEIFSPLARIADGRPDRLQSVAAGPFVAVGRAEPGALRPLVARWRHLLGAGDVRLDNRAEVERWCSAPMPDASDLEVVLAALDTRGSDCIGALIGDFAFAAWDPRAQKLVAARDAFGVKPLFYARRGDLLLVSSRLSALEQDGRYDADFLADFLVRGGSDEGRTIWDGARALPAGTVLVQRGTVPTISRFWNPAAFEPDHGGSDAERIERFRALFREAVRSRVAGVAEPWAQLSGGLDSSSVVATVETLHREGTLPHGLAGTVTVADSLGDGDERAFSGALLARYPLRNELVQDCWAWQDDGDGAPLTDEPRPILPFFERDRRMAGVVRSAGAKVLLSGVGSDHYLFGNLGYITDMMARGRFLAGFGELARWSVAQRQSFWILAREQALYPFLPRSMRLRLARPWQRVPAWLAPEFVRGHDLEARLPLHWTASAPGARTFQREIARQLSQLQAWIEREPFDDGLEVRYPFLHRPLVEFGLRLPPELRIRPQRHKWILREAMSDVLPEPIRTRVGKGGIDARILWSLEHERARLDALLEQPILADLGVVDGHALRRAVADARQGIVANLAALMFTLSLETWLAVRADRWAVRSGVAAA